MGKGADDTSYSDAFWLSVDQSAQVGDSLTPREEYEGTRRRLQALGYVQADDGQFVRQVDLGARDTLLPIGHEHIEGVDTVAMLSIDRNNGDVPYLYDTLQSTLSELPPGSIINVMVGDDNVAYVQPDVLAEHIGESFAAQVHIVPIQADIIAFIREQKWSLFARSNYNYARTLRSYKGRRGLLFLEDDIGWSMGSSKWFGRLLRQTDAEAISLFNPYCAPRDDKKCADLVTLRSKRVSGFDAHGTQAMLFRPKFVQHVGNHLFLRMGLNHYDLTMFSHMERMGMPIDVVRPSMVQHLGLKSTVNTDFGWSIVSQCFFPIYPRQPVQEPAQATPPTVP